MKSVVVSPKSTFAAIGGTHTYEAVFFNQQQDVVGGVTFARLTSITGPNAAFGAQLKNGTEQAVEDINAAGGVMGQKLALSVGDDVSDPKQGVSVANNFTAEGIK